MVQYNTPHAATLAAQPPGSCCRSMAAWPTRQAV